MKKLMILCVAVGLIALASCNKDQAAVKDLSGTWLEKKVNDTDIPFDSASTVVFEKCKLKKEEYCTFTTTYSDGTSDANEYKVTEDGTILVTREPGSSFLLESTITELTNEKLVLTTTLFGTTTIVEYDKK